MSDIATAQMPPVQATPPGGAAALRQIAGLWWVPLVRGVMLIALGGYALLTPGVTLMAYTVVLGVFVLMDSVMALVAGVFGWVESRWWAIVRGVIGVAAALFVLANPLLVGAIAVTTLVLLLAIQSIAGGVLEIVAAIRERNQIDGEWWLVLGGLLSIAFGAILLSAPLVAGAVLIQIPGVFAILAGVALIVAAFRLRSFGAKDAAEA